MYLDLQKGIINLFSEKGNKDFFSKFKEIKNKEQIAYDILCENDQATDENKILIGFLFLNNASISDWKNKVDIFKSWTIDLYEKKEKKNK